MKLSVRRAPDIGATIYHLGANGGMHRALRGRLSPDCDGFMSVVFRLCYINAEVRLQLPRLWFGSTLLRAYQSLQ